MARVLGNSITKRNCLFKRILVSVYTLNHLYYALSCCPNFFVIQPSDIMITSTSYHNPPDVLALIFTIRGHDTNYVSCLQSIHPFVMVPVFHCNDPAFIDLPKESGSPSHCFYNQTGLYHISVAALWRIPAEQCVIMVRFRYPVDIAVIVRLPARGHFNIPVS